MRIWDGERGRFINVDPERAAQVLLRAARDAGGQFLSDSQAHRLALAALREAEKSPGRVGGLLIRSRPPEKAGGLLSCFFPKRP